MYKHSLAHKYVTGRKQQLLGEVFSVCACQNIMLASKELHELTLMHQKTMALETVEEALDCRSCSTKLTYGLNWLNVYQIKLESSIVNDHIKAYPCTHTQEKEHIYTA